MYKRLELHNHTTESDGAMTCRELADYMEGDGVHAFALTDHNTISGHEKMRLLLEEHRAGNRNRNNPGSNGCSISCIYGMEYTTYYGHILCLNLKEYVPWETIDRRHPERLFLAAREKGALVGIAHPFSLGAPFAKGCRFEMELTDFKCVDFIEIFNDYEPLHQVNEPALRWWEDLVFAGQPVAATCGMDLHGRLPFAGQYATYIEGRPKGVIAKELEAAIRSQRTWISRGPLLLTEVDHQKGLLRFSIFQTGKNGYDTNNHPPYLIGLTTRKGTILHEVPAPESQKAETAGSKHPLPGTTPPVLELPISELDGERLGIPKLYEADGKLENLLCTSPAVSALPASSPLRKKQETY